MWWVASYLYIITNTKHYIMTTQEIKSALNNKGINTESGIYKGLEFTIADHIDTAKEFGYDYWLNQTTSGSFIRDIVKNAL